MVPDKKDAVKYAVEIVKVAAAKPGVNANEIVDLLEKSYEQISALFVKANQDQ